jgi:hypothetical protein
VNWAWNDSGVTVTGRLSGSRQLQSCAQCGAARDRCHTGCDSEANDLEKLKCVNRCNKEYECVMGHDCK